jgi:carboxypeptidase T
MWQKIQSRASSWTYHTSGTSDDYAYSRHIVNANNQKIYGFTIEFGKEETGFIPLFSEMQNVIKK